MIRRFFSQCLLSLKDNYGEINVWELILFVLVLPVLSLLSVCVFAGYSFNTSDVRWWIVGSVIAGNSYSLIFSIHKRGLNPSP